MDSARLYQSTKVIQKTFESIINGGSLRGGQLPSYSMSSNKEHTEDDATKRDNNALATDPFSSLEDTAIEESEKTELELAMDKLSNQSKLSFDSISRSPYRSVRDSFVKMHELFIQRIFDFLFGSRTDSCEKGEQVSPSGDLQYKLKTIDPTQFSVVTNNITTTASVYESEFTSFNANGIVNTDDGRSIEVNLSISMSSSFEASFSQAFSFNTLRCTDPLVINLFDAPANLKDLKFFFDLDADGTEEEISSLANGSGFLALDKNDDGIINDGSELFGVKSGNGFKDLAMYDEDHNGWIDENDSIFEKLKIWVKDENGNDLLYTLKDKNVGAICLQNQDTDFGLRSSRTFEMNGYVRKTGVFLYEDGNAGTIQHVDLVS